jgi:hypothetical protein
MRAFREASPTYVRSRLVAALPDASPEQVAAWDESIPPLQREISEVMSRDDTAADFSTILEYTLPLNHRRPDVLFLMDGAVAVVEAKGKDRATQADLDQVAAYARDLRAYHESCADAPVHPVLLLTRASERLGRQGDIEITGPDGLDEVIAELVGRGGRLVPASEFLDARRYRPLPSLIKAARELFELGDLRRIRRASAATGPAIDALADLAHRASQTKTRHLALVTGSPGTGKTLVGLSLVHAPFLDDLAIPRENGSKAVPSVFLSGNGPLIHVLQYELRGAGGGGRSFVRDVKSYVERYLANPQLVPGEHVVVFDEAQRAFDAGKLARVQKRQGARSEPDHLIEFGARIPDWCLIVGLIGQGQELHDGEEAGVEQWRWALDQIADRDEWTVTVPPSLASVFEGWEQLRVEPALQLREELRFHAARTVHDFVERLLADSPDQGLATTAAKLEREGYHLRITRDLAVAKQYLRTRYAENPDARFGVVASSRDQELPRFGIFNDWNATRNVRVGPWFCDPPDEPMGRSGRSLVDCVTEFGCQGLELDAVLLAWGTDFILEGGSWTNRHARRYQSPHLIKDPFQLRRNAYRVLLTRGRDATVVFVPQLPALDETFELLLASGFRELDDPTLRSLGSDARQPESDARQPEVDVPEELVRLLQRAREANPMTRIELRDPIAAYGAAALPGLVRLATDGFGAFAIRAISRVAELGAPYDARLALDQINRAQLSTAELKDLDAALARLASRRSAAVRPRRAPAAGGRTIAVLRRGEYHVRRDLQQTLGGNPQTGISYPSRGDHAMLFSGGTGRDAYGYEDHWLGEDAYLYYGEWMGRRDMAMDRGNLAVVERSPNLYLFIERGNRGYQFQGRFEHVSNGREGLVVDGEDRQAIVFTLRRVADEVAI